MLGLQLLVLLVYLIVLHVLMEALALSALHHMLLIIQIFAQHVSPLIITLIVYVTFAAHQLHIATPAQIQLPAHRAVQVTLAHSVMPVIRMQDTMPYQMDQPYASSALL